MQLATLQRVALEAACNQRVERVLEAIASGLTADSSIALARVWLLGPGDRCDDCALRPDCPSQERCLHLAASSGRSRVDPSVTWDQLEGCFSRFPLGIRKVGRVGASGQPEYICSHAQGRDWLADREWGDAEGITCFAGQPLIFRGEVLGVLAIFCRDSLDEDKLLWLRTFADQAAVAIANARAFHEIEELRARLELERDYLRDELHGERHPAGIIGDSPAMQTALEQVARVAPTDASVLVLGETGTGKELIASALHQESDRAEAPLVRVNCAATPHELFESEFFGHVKGSFTGASRDRAGRFEVADGGTIFLDEVGEIPLDLQGKLLRVLQEGQFSRVGEDEVREVDVRVVAATNRDLEAEARAGRFREDLYYRLAVVTVDLPPLRERQGDIELLARHFLRSATSRRNASGLILRPEDVAALNGYGWPGNVRELHNVIERAVILSSHDRLHLDLTPSAASAGPANAEAAPPARAFDTEEQRLDRMRRDVLAALEKAGGRVSGRDGAAELLGIRPTTLRSRMKSLGIERKFE